ncbi:MAG: family 10 glycosylhydrolase [Streptosporangiales bacterium]|nr:family 10 glycosylhydrolase [Streptosporangiales bacterium]
MRPPMKTDTVTVAALAAALAVAVAASIAMIVMRTPEPRGSVSAAEVAEGPAPAAKRELRGMWITTVGNLDWPSKPGLSVARQKAEYRKLLDTAQRLNLNAVFVQVRPVGDVFYPSSYEPWSQYLTGKQGRDPGYDPLAFMLEETHKRNLDFHAWFNPYRAAGPGAAGGLAANHMAKKHPDWVIKYGGSLYLDPGNPAVRDHMRKVVDEVVTKYDIDGVHLDDFFYPYPIPGQRVNDDASYKKYGDGKSRATWRRANVDALISGLNDDIHEEKPWVRFGVSPFGVWRNKSTDPKGSNTQAGVQAYDDIGADVRGWVKKGWLDYVMPQLYWSVGFKPADYATLAAWWSRQVKDTGVKLYIGQAVYKVGDGPPAAWDDPGELLKHLKVNAEHPEVEGDVYFRATNLTANPLKVADRLADGPYRDPAIPPAAGGSSRPEPVRDLKARADAEGVRLSWSPAEDADEEEGRGTTAYAVYRLGHGRPVKDAKLIATFRAGSDAPGYLDRGAPEGKRNSYLVTALDRLHHESSPSRSEAVTPR